MKRRAFKRHKGNEKEGLREDFSYLNVSHLKVLHGRSVSNYFLVFLNVLKIKNNILDTFETI